VSSIPQDPGHDQEPLAQAHEADLEPFDALAHAEDDEQQARVPGRAGVVMITTKSNSATVVQYGAGVEKLKEGELRA